ADSAALARHFDVDAREMENEAIAQYRNAAPVEQNRGDFSSPLLQKIDGFIEKEVRDRNGEKQKGAWKACASKRVGPDDKRATGDPEKNKREDDNKELINLAKPQTERVIPRRNQARRNKE